MKSKFWNAAAVAATYAWLFGVVGQLLGLSTPGVGWHTSVTFLVLWVVLPLFWMACSGFGLHDHFEHELGIRRHTTSEGYIKVEDTIPTKRIILQWLAPFALCYFILRNQFRKQRIAAR